MIQRIKTKFNKNKILFENFFSLSALQAAGYILPLITLPYLARVLGVEKFGLIAFAQAFIAYFVLITDYGFNLSATREVSISRQDNKKISEIFYSVFTVKLILLIFAFLIFLLITSSFDKFRSEYLVFIFSFILVLGNLLFPTWLFQGMERMKYITIINVLIKSLFIIPIFIFIRVPSDYTFVPLINSAGFVLSGIVGFFVAIRVFKIKPYLPSFKDIIHQFKEGWYIFISTLAISLYTISNTFILGLFTNNTIVGYYSGAEKIVKAVQGLITPLSQTVYPHISSLVSESKEIAINFLRKLVRYVGFITFFMSIILFIFADKAILIFLGSNFEKSTVILRILAFLPFVIGLSNIFGIQTMLTFNMKKAFSRILMTISLLSIVLTLILVQFYSAVGVAISVLITEILVTLIMFIHLRRKHINLV